jgi:hypothetical protein
LTESKQATTFASSSAGASYDASEKHRRDADRVGTVGSLPCAAAIRDEHRNRAMS